MLVPINFMLKEIEAGYILRHAEVQLLATESGLADLARGAAQGRGCANSCGCLPKIRPSLRLA